MWQQKVLFPSHYLILGEVLDQRYTRASIDDGFDPTMVAIAYA
jgi:hypothetical protein